MPSRQETRKVTRMLGLPNKEVLNSVGKAGEYLNSINNNMKAISENFQAVRDVLNNNFEEIDARLKAIEEKLNGNNTNESRTTATDKQQ